MQDHPFIKAQIAKLPDAALASAAVQASAALHIDATGRPIRSVDDSTGHIYGLTTAVPHDGYLYLGTDRNGSNDVMRYRL